MLSTAVLHRHFRHVSDQKKGNGGKKEVGSLRTSLSRQTKTAMLNNPVAFKLNFFVMCDGYK